MDARILVCACGMGLGSRSAHGREHLGVRMRNGVGQQECSWTHVCSCARVEWGWEVGVLMGARILVCGMRMGNGVGMRERSWMRVYWYAHAEWGWEALFPRTFNIVSVL
jgi:hypothetical protein